MKKCFWSASTLPGSNHLPFVISTEAQSSGEICRSSGPFLEMFFDRSKRNGGDPRLLPLNISFGHNSLSWRRSSKTFILMIRGQTTLFVRREEDHGLKKTPLEGHWDRGRCLGAGGREQCLCRSQLRCTRLWRNSQRNHHEYKCDPGGH